MSDREKQLVYNLQMFANLLITMPNSTMEEVFAGFPDPIERLNFLVSEMRAAAENIRTRRSMIDETVKGFQAAKN